MGLQTEQRLEEVLRSVVKRMIARLQKCLIGNKRTDIPACFTVTLVIDKNNRIELKPSIQVSTRFNSTNSNFCSMFCAGKCHSLTDACPDVLAESSG